MSYIRQVSLDVEAIYSIDDFDQLKEIVSVLEKEVNDLKKERDKLSANVRRMENLDDEVDDDIETQNLLVRERLLKAHLRDFDSHQPTDCSVNEAVCALITDESHAKACSNLLVQTAWTEKRIREETSLIEKLTLDIERDKDIIRGIEEKTEELLARADDQRAENDTHRARKLERKSEVVKLEVAELVTAMSDFIDEQFPAPEPAYDDVYTPQSQNSDIAFVSLNVIMETLTNTFIDTPNDCFVNIKRDWWPRHIEMLLRRGICVAHPKDKKKIRLEYYDAK